MTLQIKLNKDTSEITVGYDSKPLIISDTSEQWSSEGINKFLLRIARNKRDDEAIELKPATTDEFSDDDKNHELFEQLKLIHMLFNKFKDGIN